MISVLVSIEEVASSRISIGGRQSITRVMHSKLLLTLRKASAVLADHRVVAAAADA